MPELPEVETVATDLRTELVDRCFVGAHILWPRTLAAPNASELVERIVGRQVIDVGRRGKFLLVHLDDGQTLVIVTHDARIAATADRLITMRDGAFVDETRLSHGTTRPLGELAGLEG